MSYTRFFLKLILTAGWLAVSVVAFINWFVRRYIVSSGGDIGGIFRTETPAHLWGLAMLGALALALACLIWP